MHLILFSTFNEHFKITHLREITVVWERSVLKGGGKFDTEPGSSGIQTKVSIMK